MNHKWDLRGIIHVGDFFLCKSKTLILKTIYLSHRCVEIIDVFRREGPLRLTAVVGLMSDMGHQDIYYGIPSVKSPGPFSSHSKSEGNLKENLSYYHLGITWVRRGRLRLMP